MFPEIEIFGISIPWFELVELLTLIIVIAFALYLNRKDDDPFGMNNQSLLMFPVMGIAFFVVGTIGSRLMAYFELIFQQDVEPPSVLEIFKISSKIGASWYGGFILVASLLFITLKILKVERRTISKLFNYLALYTCLTYALGRFACLLSGDGCYGTTTTCPLGMKFPYGSAPTIFPVHPTPLYESIVHLLLFILLLRVRKNEKPKGVVYFLLGTSISRLLIEFIRLNPSVAFGLSLAQLTSIIIILFTITIILFNKLKHEN